MYIQTLYRNCKSTINKKEYHSFLFKNDTLFIIPLHIKLPQDSAVHGKVLLDHERTIDSQSEDRECKKVGTVSADFLDKVLNLLMLTYKKSH